MNKGTHVMFSSANEIYDGFVVSGRPNRHGEYLVERQRIDPDVQEAQWWRRPEAMIVLDREGAKP